MIRWPLVRCSCDNSMRGAALLCYPGFVFCACPVPSAHKPLSRHYACPSWPKCGLQFPIRSPRPRHGRIRDSSSGMIPSPSSTQPKARMPEAISILSRHSYSSAAIRKLTSLPVRFVINTHYHVDHVGGNAVFVNAGAVVLSHHNVRGWIHSENLRMFGKDIKAGQKVFIEALLPPTVTSNQTVELHLGSRRIRLQSFPGTHRR